MKNTLFTDRHRTIVIIILLLVFIAAFVSKNTSNVQSAQEINLSIYPCVTEVYEQTSVIIFTVDNPPNICGIVLSDYLPLELRVTLINKSLDEEVVSFQYEKIVAHEFLIDLPDDLAVGEYEFEIRSGRRHVGSTSFTVVE